MSTLPQIPADEPTQTQCSLRNLLAIALHHFRDPEWLGENSPLASLFFLGEYALKQHDLNLSKPADRGRGLATAAAARAIQACEELAVRPLWNAAQHNAPSVALARCLGFVTEQPSTSTLGRSHPRPHDPRC